MFTNTITNMQLNLDPLEVIGVSIALESLISDLRCSISDPRTPAANLASLKTNLAKYQRLQAKIAHQVDVQE
jgi:hypothetical protein